MSNVAYIDTTPDEWNRGPDPQRAREIKRLRRRQEIILEQAVQLLTRRTHGGEKRLYDRFDKLARLHAQEGVIVRRLTELGV